MLKILKNTGLFKKADHPQKEPDSGKNVSNKLESGQKTKQPHGNDMCCGKCGGGKEK